MYYTGFVKNRKLFLARSLLGKYNHLDSTSCILQGEYLNAINDYRVGFIMEYARIKKDQSTELIYEIPKDIDIALNSNGTKLYYIDNKNKLRTIENIQLWWEDAHLAINNQNDNNLCKKLQNFLNSTKNNALSKGLRPKSNDINLNTAGLNYEDKDPQTIQVKYGHSKDYRPDLKQVMLSLTVNGDANIPIWMEPQDGNSSDKTSFHETIARVENFKDQLKLNHDFIWVADSALYNTDKLLKYNDMLWISRVPETIKDCKSLLELNDASFHWETNKSGYSCAEIYSNYGAIPQRWILVSSKQAYEREKITFENMLQKQKDKAQKDCWHLSKQVFNCEVDAEPLILELKKKYKFLQLSSQVLTIETYAKKGRPNNDASKIVSGYQVLITINENAEAIAKQLRTKGRFIIATNDISNSQSLAPFDILAQYKEQQDIECGFKFLKDPWFMVDSFFVKNANRIAALMMIMTLSLLVYNFAQNKLRTALQQQKETIPNQLDRPVKNPTLRWVFQIMEGIGIVKVYNKSKRLISKLVTNLDELRLKIIRLFGSFTCEMYGI